ncbi:Versicolorin B synthase [Podospora aff. communis PSN243]|uniref:Versicolorin B synthase n=1 Tax=Podospora aff. communis PSN243 TaxID=3040156 RepID=A0AAV9GUL8_9PEZI|nr:Versicolorin B synthase [Podospora aff. communis PSN243]
MTADSERFDYIVVGGGTAGLVVASRLTEDSNIRVLVVEAGSDHRNDPLVLTPGLVTATYGKTEYDWNFSSVPQQTLNGRQINQARGKMLGGSSALNFMMLLYPSRAIIDAWASIGNEGWDFDSLAPYFRKFATVHAPPQAAKDVVGLTYHDESLEGGNGPIQVSFSEGYGVANDAWFKSFSALGLEVKTDPRDGTALGAFQNAATIDPATKTRSYAVTGYYTPTVAARPNLVVQTESLVSRVLFESSDDELPRAIGVEIVDKSGSKTRMLANSEVILAAGALQTPQILELSGIGDASLLKKHGIDVVVENPNVGENMQDHAIVCQSFEVNDGIPSADVLRDPQVLQALMQMYQADGAGGGPLGQSNISVAYTPLVDRNGLVSQGATRDLLGADSGDLNSDSHRVVSTLMQSGEAVFQYLLFPSQITINARPASMAEHLIPSRPENYITVMTILNHPFSRGRVHITSADVATLPEWDPRFNSNPLDMEVLARGVQFVERIVDPALPFGKLLKPGGKRVPEIVADNLDGAKEVVREAQISVFHVSGSCAMLPRDKGGVVDHRLRVYGTRKLRVVDASVFPLEPSGNIQSTVYAVAEKAADIIKQDRRA